MISLSRYRVQSRKSRNLHFNNLPSDFYVHKDSQPLNLSDSGLNYNSLNCSNSFYFSLNCFSNLFAELMFNKLLKLQKLIISSWTNFYISFLFDFYKHGNNVQSLPILYITAVQIFFNSKSLKLVKYSKKTYLSKLEALQCHFLSK